MVRPSCYWGSVNACAASIATWWRRSGGTISGTGVARSAGGDRRNDPGRQLCRVLERGESAAGLEASNHEVKRQAVKRDSCPVGDPDQQQGVEDDQHHADDEAPLRAVSRDERDADEDTGNQDVDDQREHLSRRAGNDLVAE